MLIVLFITDTLALAREYYFLSSFLTFQLVCSFFFFFLCFVCLILAGHRPFRLSLFLEKL